MEETRVKIANLVVKDVKTDNSYKNGSMATLNSSATLETLGINEVGVRIHAEVIAVKFTSRGRGLAWLGPAFRGIVARELKHTACQWPEHEQNQNWQYCKGCPHSVDCEYAATYESESVPKTWFKSGTSDGQRAITLAPAFPSKERIEFGDQLGLRLLLVGENAINARDSVLQSIKATGSKGKLGPDGVRFASKEIPTSSQSLFLNHGIVQTPADNSVIKTIKVSLNTPLFLKHAMTNGKKRAVVMPSFSQLFAASLRVVARCFSENTGRSLDETIDFKKLKESYNQVQSVHENWQRFEQRKYSNRKQSGFGLIGATGSAIYERVPAQLIPWLELGGQLGIGNHRVAGAGIFSVSTQS